jgi:hypothetical protein
MKLAEHIACMVDMRNEFKLSDGKSEGTKPLGRPRRRWEGNIKMDIKDICFDNVYWIHLAKITSSGGLF